jgi:predicted ATP-dependent protease
LTFEQTYSEVEGDSATVAELIAILSSLADVPVRQWLAITGSANQVGEVQPIGGVNEKIEGFFESCKRRGLTGKEGVIIPSRNCKHLALRRDLVKAVESGQFVVYAVGTVEEAIELLTGFPAGERGLDGLFPPDTIYGRVAARLEEMAQTVAEWSEAEIKPGGRIITES